MEDVTYKEQLANIARDYYLSNLTIAQISEKYNISRYLISKSLDEALSSGLVKISINTPIERNLEMEARFKRLFNIENAYIVKDADTSNEDNENIVNFAAQTLQDKIKRCRTVGVSWGGTVMNTINHFQADVRDDLIFNQIMGDNLKYSSPSGSTPLVQKAAAKYGAHYQTVPAPLYIFNDSVRENLAKEPAFIPAFSTMSKMDMIFAGIGTLASIDTIPVWKQHKAEIFQGVDPTKIVGMLYGRPFDIDGNILNTTTDKLFGASIDTLLAVPSRLVIVKSKFKARPLLGALRGHLITDFVSNESIANRVLMEMES
ncbi:sugar-binding transcriptional regulator [Lentilactobacillus sp. SPB1-3]|uniref:Sugar-binding transcriptional regulator n=1 Tax=Lentilactobacillus terminaliae TaxID=3003483 RepID=A0ACD5DGH6_9LACO|nr:sugar-binding domain-containing protein [Lentilactobacillus sp. SPB1-3]MCZ0976684.1 sugar-binding transcriptional regulator [Lentilactobacillus sp. SPB1-3]